MQKLYENGCCIRLGYFFMFKKKKEAKCPFII